MKLGNLDGSPQEISDLFENNGLRLTDYLEATEVPLPRRWIVVPACVVVFVLLLILLVRGLSARQVLLLFVLGLVAGTWLAASVQVRFRKATVTVVVALGVLLSLLVAAGLITPRETVEYIPNGKQGGLLRGECTLPMLAGRHRVGGRFGGSEAVIANALIHQLGTRLPPRDAGPTSELAV